MVRSTLRVAAVQMCSGDDVTRNLDDAQKWVRAAAAAGAELVALPENFAFLGSDRDKVGYGQGVEESALLAPLRALARALGIGILAGSIPETGPDAAHVYNTSVLLGKAGETLGAYRKIHLFDIELGNVSLRESAHVSPGASPCVADFEAWRVGLSVCYDLRFPELYRRESNDGARILTVPAAFTLHTGKDHWATLLRARAIENLCYVIAPGQFGPCGPGKVSWGKSMIVDPWGTVLATAPERVGFVMAELDLAEQDRVRRELPALSHRTQEGVL